MNKSKKNCLKIAMIILAAGDSKRMGTIKQLLPWHKTTLLRHAIEQGLASDVNEVFVVLGANYKIIADHISQYNINSINNSNWSQGMGTSIASAMHYLYENNLNYDAVLIALSDQPLVDIKYYNYLINKYITSAKNIIASQNKDRIGVPAIFGSGYFETLSKLRQDIGARKIISMYTDDLQVVKGEGKLIDVDTVSDYKTLFQKYGEN
jgi:molybdenum cofactor cytidylyltransferase